MVGAGCARRRTTSERERCGVFLADGKLAAGNDGGRASVLCRVWRAVEPVQPAIGLRRVHPPRASARCIEDRGSFARSVGTRGAATAWVDIDDACRTCGLLHGVHLSDRERPASGVLAANGTGSGHGARHAARAVAGEAERGRRFSRSRLPLVWIENHTAGPAARHTPVPRTRSVMDSPQCSTLTPSDGFVLL
jgi:hypothetical protein